jgi:glycosyltransferase involved in cell wall biosynthesis
LAPHLEIVAVVDDSALGSARAPAGVEVVGAGDAVRRRFALDVYQLGNSWRYHGFMFPTVVRRPGLVAMHDPSIFDFVEQLTGGRTSPVLAEEVAYDSKGRFALATLPTVEVDGRSEVDRLEVMMCRRIVEASRCVLVHSEAIATLVEQRYGVRPRRVPHVKSAIERPRSSGGARRLDRPVTFGMFGGLAAHKRPLVVLESFVELIEDGMDACLLIAGHADDARSSLACRKSRRRRRRRASGCGSSCRRPSIGCTSSSTLVTSWCRCDGRRPARRAGRSPSRWPSASRQS